MLTDIINSIVTALRNGGVTPVYSAFDAVNVAEKSKGIFTVVGLSSFESDTPIYSQYTIFFPFKAEFEIKITSPENCSLSQIYSYYDEKIDPVISEISGLTCRLSGVSAKFDSNIQRLVLTVKLSASGITKHERSTS
jgi:hypothetical protein